MLNNLIIVEFLVVVQIGAEEDLVESVTRTGGLGRFSLWLEGQCGRPRTGCNGRIRRVDRRRLRARSVWKRSICLTIPLRQATGQERAEIAIGIRLHDLFSSLNF